MPDGDGVCAWLGDRGCDCVLDCEPEAPWDAVDTCDGVLTELRVWDDDGVRSWLGDRENVCEGDGVCDPEGAWDADAVRVGVLAALDDCDGEGF